MKPARPGTPAQRSPDIACSRTETLISRQDACAVIAPNSNGTHERHAGTRDVNALSFLTHSFRQSNSTKLCAVIEEEALV